MKRRDILLLGLPLLTAIVCLAALGAWLAMPAPQRESVRVPVAYPRPTAKPGQGAGRAGVLIPGKGQPSAQPGSWPQFRGANRDNIATSKRELARAWPGGGPKILWRIPVGEGHAGVAINQGRVYLLDYDRAKQQDAIRCLSLDSGAEIWRYVYPVKILRNHGMSRTVPAVTDRYVVTLGPKCHVVCLDALTGKLVWKKDLVAECGTIVPPWYAGQCPLIDGDRVILAPGAKPLMMAVELASGKTLWATRDHDAMGMTHSSIVAMNFQGQKEYLYCAKDGVAGVAAADGRVLWTYPQWKINIANVPSPIPVGEDRIFFSGGYESGCAMVRLVAKNGAIAAKELFRLKPTVFGSNQQTPILYQDYLYGVIPDGTMACLDVGGKRRWTSGETRFGLGPYLLVNGLMLALNDENGTLHLAEVSPAGYKEISQCKLLGGHDAWGPLAWAEGRLIARDLTEMVCVDLGK